MTVTLPCPDVTASGGRLCVRFPGGAPICANVPTLNPPNLQLARAVMGQANAAMAPLQPIFDIIGAITAVKDLVEALVADPFDIADVAQELGERVDRLATLVPQLSVPAMALDIVDALLTYMEGVAESLAALAAQENRIQAAVAVAESQNLDVLRQAAGCASTQLNAYFAGIKASNAPIDDLIELLNGFLGQVPGAPEIPTLGDLGDGLQEASDALSEQVDLLRSVREMIPL